MHCLFCEEPFRSVTLGLAALGIVALVRVVLGALRRYRTQARSTVALDTAP